MKRSEAIDLITNILWLEDGATSWEVGELILKELEEYEVVTQKWEKEDESIN